jgi:hypothetical protein
LCARRFLAVKHRSTEASSAGAGKVVSRWQHNAAAVRGVHWCFAAGDSFVAALAVVSWRLIAS